MCQFSFFFGGGGSARGGGGVVFVVYAQGSLQNKMYVLGKGDYSLRFRVVCFSVVPLLWRQIGALHARFRAGSRSRS